MTSSRSGGRTGRPGEIPKAFDAFKLWRLFSRELEADFQRFYHLDIREWYTGAMDSRRFLALVDGLPAESNFSRWAIRRGDWTEDQYITARGVNETALARADGKGYNPQLVKSPLQLDADAAEDAYRRRRHDETMRQLKGDN